MQNVNEIMRAAAQIRLECARLEATAARAHIERALATFAPFRVTGHLGIGRDSDAYRLEVAERDYSLALDPGPVRLFFDQSSSERHEVVQLADGRRLSELMQECFGIEYFVGDQGCRYLIAVNWYVVEVAGIARDWLRARYPVSRNDGG